jgi:hypothetical protein
MRKINPHQRQTHSMSAHLVEPSLSARCGWSYEHLNTKPRQSAVEVSLNGHQTKPAGLSQDESMDVSALNLGDRVLVTLSAEEGVMIARLGSRLGRSTMTANVGAFLSSLSSSTQGKSGSTLQERSNALAVLVRRSLSGHRSKRPCVAMLPR